jgi:hypothetical protein
VRKLGASQLDKLPPQIASTIDVDEAGLAHGASCSASAS